MAIYAIGDVQGCFAAFERLIAKIQFNPVTDQLWFTGDLVNRGPNSLAVMRYVYALGDRAITVLGNHDLHLLAVAYAGARISKSDTLDELLTADDREQLLTWLRHRPLLHHVPGSSFILVHAGLAPQWDLATASQCAKEVETLLQGDDFVKLLQNMYGDHPKQWSTELSGWDRYRYIINCFTRIRFCNQQGELELSAKGDLAHAPKDCQPWFSIQGRRNHDLNIIFGHWAALYNDWQQVIKLPGIYPLDSGCVWGNCLSAIRLDDGQRFEVQCEV